MRLYFARTLAVLLVAATPWHSISAQRGNPATANSAERARWQREAQAVTITRDDWGIPHIVGKTDADAVFGLLYAQAEDDFNRVETNYLNAMGRLAESEGESAIYRDLRMKLFINTDSLKKMYASSPASLKKLMDAFADGLNYYLATHPAVKPLVITHFEPWMALSFSEGSIGGDVEKVNLNQLASFYGNAPEVPIPPAGSGPYVEPGGSNGMAIAPANTRDRHALLLINPHTSFFFRAEVQVTSGEGLNAYGAVTWGQFFVYQGFNDNIGWMHTSSGVDAVDEYLETISRAGNRWMYRHGGQELPVTVSTIVVPYKTATGMAQKSFTVFRTPHGPVVRKAPDGRWVTIAMMNEPVKALTQSYTRTKAHSFAEFRQSLELHTNSSNNTILADKAGDIAYFHGNFIPRRDPKFDWTKPVDGSDPATDWHGLLSVDESPHLLNPASGWLYNSNNAPWWSSGESSPKKADFPAYVEIGGESARGQHAERVLRDKKDFTLNSLLDAAFDSYQTWFEKPIPALIKAWDAASASNPLKAKVADQIALLRDWDLRWGAASVPTSLAVFWGTDIQRHIGVDARRAGVPNDEYIATRATGDQLLQSLAAASDKLTADFGKWQTPWGDINRFQRLTGDIVQPFSDAGPSIPVPFTSAEWGSLASFGAHAYPGTKKWYGTSGNSFVAVVEFGDSIRARAVTAGGESGHPDSPHFDDEATRYASGNLRDVYFYRSQLKGHTERVYHPGG
ncbi:MAG TPA: acylase [Gemmatimonadales bacterium]|jgi:acyl-homoserine lactone acylase PvdQ